MFREIGQKLENLLGNFLTVQVNDLNMKWQVLFTDDNIFLGRASELESMSGWRSFTGIGDQWGR